MIYVMSDIHGEYAKYMRMLEKISFSDGDTLFVLGDVLDRGPEPIRIIQDMVLRENVFLLRGNHEGMAQYVLERLNVEITQKNAETQLDMTLMQALMVWQQNGGDVTMKAFAALPREERLDVLDYIADTPLYEMVDAGDKTFLLVHAGLGHFDAKKKLRDYTYDELTTMRPDYDKRYFNDPDLYIVCGHTPTLAVTGKAEIYHGAQQILIDCGAAYGGRLACLCLDTMQEFYVE